MFVTVSGLAKYAVLRSRICAAMPVETLINRLRYLTKSGVLVPINTAEGSGRHFLYHPIECDVAACVCEASFMKPGALYVLAEAVRAGDRELILSVKKIAQAIESA